MNKALFLDRDGVLNRELGRYVESVDEFEILPTVPEALGLAHAAGYLLILISNQGGIAKGLYVLEDVYAMQRKLEAAIRPFGARITEGYYCPHHPDKGRCLCRKPAPLMLQKAMARFHIDASSSFMIGDTPRDMEAAETAGVKGILVPSNSDLLETVKTLV